MTRPGILILTLLSTLVAQSGWAQPNVLFINIDDLNNFPAEYYPDLSTPNIDRLANMGVAFKNAHSPVPACNPSRTALLMGKHPDATGIVLNSQFDFRSESPLLTSAASLPQHFKDNGYRIVGAGKLFHLPNDDAPYTEWDSYTLALSGLDFQTFLPRPTHGLTGLMDTDPDGIMGIIPRNIDWGHYENGDSLDRTVSTPDYARAAWAVTQIQDASSQQQPTFVSVGLYRPHLPHYCPKRFFDGLPDPISEIPYLVDDLDDIPDPHGGPSYDADLEFATIRDGVDYQAQHARAYVACVAFIDELLGMILDALDSSDEEWLTILWGDHGFHLGEKDRWQKFTLWDRGTRTTLVMAGPGIPVAVQINAAVSLLDIYPTLIDYAGLGPPGHSLDGLSLRRHIDSSTVSDVVKLLWNEKVEKYFAFKSEQWTYIVNTFTNSEELYDKNLDPNEWDNLAGDPQYDQVKSWLVPEPHVGIGLALGALAICLLQPRLERV